MCRIPFNFFDKMENIRDSLKIINLYSDLPNNRGGTNKRRVGTLFSFVQGEKTRICQNDRVSKGIRYVASLLEVRRAVYYVCIANVV